MTLEQTLAKLITFQTVSEDHIANRVALAWVKGQLSGLPLHWTELEYNGFPALIATTRDSKAPKIWLQGHMDVVPGPAELFRPQLTAKSLVGRGAYDMKFALACYIELFKSLGQKLSKYDLGLMIVTDEELGGLSGSKLILNDGWGGKAVVLPDSGDDWSFEVTAKGVWHVEVTAAGQAAHGSRPWEGDSAISRLIQFLSLLEPYFPKEPCGDDEHCHNSLTVGLLEGGQVINQIADQAKALLDVRFLPTTSKSDLQKLLNRAQPKSNPLVIRELRLDPSYTVDIRNRYWQSFKNITEQHLGAEIVTSNSHGSTDARFFIEHGIPAIVTRPRGGGHHGDSEWVDLEDLYKFYDILTAFVKKSAVVHPAAKSEFVLE